ncbi:MAG: hypothetical protein K2X82_17370 [Gemmataceae bacterium]|nr:hypothetical protein [Gemmataceae bacterium]
MRGVCAAGVLGLAALAVGCGDYPRARVHGKLTLAGRPLTGATVIFLGRDNMTYIADLHPDGSYAVDRVPEGPVRVSVQKPPPRPAPRPNPPAGWTGDAKGKIADPVDDRAKASRLDVVEAPPAKTSGPQLPARYADPNQSGLGFEVKGPDHEWSVDLKP